jgi:hypothetical protein
LTDKRLATIVWLAKKEKSQTEKAMKRIALALLATLAISSHAFAGEEINVAAAIGSGASTTSTTTTAGAAAGSTAAAATANMIAAGVIAAAGIAAISSAGGTSTTSH